MRAATPVTSDTGSTASSVAESVARIPDGELSGLAPLLSTVWESTSTELETGRIWHAVPEVRNGTGTEDDPWGSNQLITAAGRPGVALDVLQAGDSLWLGGGIYNFATDLTSDSYNYGVLAPAATDCTIRSKPGEKAVVRRISGLAPLAGSMRRGLFVAHRTRFLGIEFVEAQVPAVLPPLIRIVGTPTNFVSGCEVGYCRFIAGDLVDRTVDNHECVRVDHATAPWTHHNEMSGAKGKNGYNPCGYKEYDTDDGVCEDNWIHDNNCGVFYKTSISRAVCRRNLCVGNIMPIPNGTPQPRDFTGTEFVESGGVEVYDNIFDSVMYLSSLSQNYKIHHNLTRNANQIANHSHNLSHSIRLWNCILLSPTNACNPWWSGYTAYPGSPPALLECDYNLTVSKAGGSPVATYPYSGQTFTLAAFRAQGFEVHSQLLSGGLGAIFADAGTYTLKAAYQTAGRDGDIVGPRDPVTILDTSRYGPEALIALEATGGVVDQLVLAGPSSGPVSRPSGPWTVALGPGTLQGSVRVTPSDAEAGGVFAPGFVDLTDATRAAEFTYTPATAGVKTIGVSNSGGLVDPPLVTFVATASSYAVAGPTAGRRGAASSAFTVTPNGPFTGTVTPADGGAGGTFLPPALSWSGDATPQTFTYTPATGGPRALAFTNSADLADPAPHWYTATAASSVLSGPMPSASASRAASDFTITPDGPYDGTITPEDGGAGGVFSPPSLSWSNDAASRTFTYTPATTGPKTIVLHNSGGLVDPPSLSYVVADYTYALTGPTAGVAGVAVGPFTITPLLPLSGSIELDDDGAGGTFNPAVLGWSGDASPKAFTYTPASPGSWRIAATNTGGFLDPTPRAIAVRTPGTFVTAYSATSWSDPRSWHRDPGPIPDDWEGVQPPPGEGDIVRITYPITLDTAAAVGTSAGGGTALLIGADLVIADGATLTLHGNVLQRNGVTVTGRGAGCIRFDSSRAVPATTSYTWQVSDAAVSDPSAGPVVVIRGRPEARFRVESASGGGAGRFTHGGQAWGGQIDAEYCDFVRIGDVTADAFQPRIESGGILRLDHCTLRQCGRVAVDQGLGASATLVLNALTWAEPAATTLVSVPYPNVDRTTGTWQVTGCDFAGPVQLRSRTFTIAGNVHRAAWTLDGVARPADAGPFGPSSLALSGPAGGAVGVASGAFTLQLLPAGSKAPGVMITPIDGGAGGTFTPGSVALSDTSTSVAFTYTPATAGPRWLGAATDGPVPGGNGVLTAGPVAFTATMPATGYTLTATMPATGLAGAASAPLVVALPAWTTVAQSVRITPDDGGAGGTFAPPSMVLDSIAPSASFTYTPAGPVGPRTIRTTNDGGLADPLPVQFAVSGPVTSYTLTGPTGGEVGRASGAFVVTLGSGAVAGPVRVTPAASNGDGAFAPPFVELSAARRSASFLYTPMRWSPRTITVTNDGGLADPPDVAFVAKVQTGRSGHDPSGNRGPDLGGFDFFANGPWWRELGRDISDDPVDPDSDRYISRMDGLSVHVDGSTTTANGGNSLEGTPYNVVAGGTPRVPLTSTLSPGGSDPGPVPWPRDLTLGSFHSPTHTPSPSDLPGVDQHALVFRRDETTGGLAELWEYRGAYSEDVGETWKAHGGARFDLATGAIRRAGWTSGDAAGLPMVPLVARYDEAARGTLGHPIRVSFAGWRGGQPMLRNKYIWPARHTSYAGSPRDGLPFGARLRLKQSWYEANRDRFTGLPRTVLEGMRRRGLIVADVGLDFHISMTQDERWTMGGPEGLLDLQTIPASAFEVLLLRSEVVLSGPARGEVGVAATFTVAHQVPDDDNFGSNVSVHWTTDVGLPEANQVWHSSGLSPAVVSIDPANRSQTVAFTPPAVGVYGLRITSSDDWLPPPPLTFTAVAVGTAPVVLQLTPPSPLYGAVGRSSGTFTVALPAGAVVGAAVTITPIDGGAGGWFHPAVVVLDDANRSAGFTYVPATPGPKQIAVTNGVGLDNPAALVYVAEPGRARPRALAPTSRAHSVRRPWGKV